MEELKEFELEMDGCLVYHQSIKGFIKELIEQEKIKMLRDEIEFLERMELEFNVVVCECGESWIDSDAADLIKERLSYIKNL